MQSKERYHALAKDELCFCPAKVWSRPYLRWVNRVGGNHGRPTLSVRRPPPNADILLLAGPAALRGEQARPARRSGVVSTSMSSNAAMR
jgi:hypothetical protein